MKAWFLTGPNQMVLEETPAPALRPGYVTADVLTAQASVTEAGMITLEGDTFGLAEKLAQDGKARLPGHECCARIYEVNEGSVFKPGDRVAALAFIPCMHCDACEKQEYHACRSMELLGVSLPGIFAERVALPERGIIRVPDNLTDCEAANLQPLSDCVAGFDSVHFEKGMKVVVFGAGCLGMNMFQIAKAAGADVTVVDIKQGNLDLAMELGADRVINGMNCDAVSEIMKLTDGIGADIVFDCAGGNPKRGLAGLVVLNQAVSAVKAEGELMIMAHYGPSVEFPIGKMRSKGSKLVFPRFATLAHLEKAAELVSSGQVKIEPLVSARLEGMDKVPEMFSITGNKAGTKTINPAQVSIHTAG